MAAVQGRSSQLDFLAGGGETGALIRAHDWSATSLGPAYGWPQALKTAVGLMLTARQPAYVAWGPELISLYNDGYLPIVGTKHPGLGLPFRELWAEIWDEFRPHVEATMAGDAQHFVDLPIALAGRPGLPVGYFTFSYTALRDENGVPAGFYCAATETTDAVLSAKRREALLELDGRLRDVASPAALSFAASEVLGKVLGAARVGYGAVDPDAGTIAMERNWCAPGFDDLAGLHRFADYGSHIDDLRRGEAVANADVEIDPRTAGNAGAFAALGIRAFLDVPVAEKGRIAGQIFVHSACPRAWTAEEVAFARAFAERTHAAIARRVAEQELRSSEARQSFALTLADTLRPLADANSIKAAAAAVLGRTIGASQVLYGEDQGDGEQVLLLSGYRDSVPDATGMYRYEDYGRGWHARLRSGEVLAFADIASDPEFDEARRNAFLSLEIRAALIIPLIKGDRLVALAAVHFDTPHRFTERDVAFASETAERTWSAVERARAEEALRASEARLQAIVNQATAGIAQTDLEGRFLAVNDRYCAIVGRSRDDLLRSRMQDLTHPDDVGANLPLFAAAAGGGAPFDIEKRYLRPDGSTVWVRNSVTGIRGGSGRVDAMLAVSVDLTDRRQAEQRLRESEALLSAVLDALPVGVIIARADGHIVRDNAANRELWGLPPETTSWEQYGDWVGWWPDTGERIKAEEWGMARALLHGEVVNGELVENQRFDTGERRCFLNSAAPVRDASGEIVAGVVSALDVTAQRAVETRLRESEARYRQIVEGADDFAIVTLDEHGVITGWNSGAERIVGYPREEAIGRPGEIIFTPEDRESGAHVHELNRASVDERAVNERWHLRKDGTRFWGSGLTMRLEGERGGYLKMFRDRTAEHEAEARLRESEARLAFLDRLGAETAGLADADAVLATTTQLLGQHLNLSVCAYADMDEDEDGFTIRGDWAAPGSKSIVGHYSLADFGRLAVENLSAGLPLVVNDNLRELAPEEAATFQSIGIAATICMPLVKEGRLTALMAIHDRVPRVWTDQELDLLRQVTARSWAHVERVAAIADLRESEERFRTALQIETVGAIYFDMAGTLTDANDAFLRMGGYSREDVEAGRLTWQNLTPPEWLADSERAFAELKARGQTTPYEKEYVRKDGTRWWALFAAKLLPDGTGFEFVVDITDRKAAEARLRELNETLEAQVAERTAERDRTWNNARDLLLVVGTDGVFRAVNPAWQAALGWREHELVGRGYLEFIHPDDHPSSREALSTATRRDLPTYENRYRHKDGSYRVISWVAAPEGELIYASGRDVTAERSREAELALAQEALRQAQKMEAMGQLTGGVAHDFNNLLTPIVGSLDLLMRRGLGNEREQRLIAGAMQSAERAKTLVQRLLAFARRQPLQATAVDLPNLVYGMAGLIGSTLGPNVEVRVELADDLPPARADANQLEMALLNLAVNARDAMPEGGVLTIAAARESVPAGHRANLKHGHYVRLSVTDTGTGMDAETLARAVEPFFSTKGIGKGTGLGLSMVHGLAAQLGGGVTLTSELGRGTAVDLWLPISAEPLADGDERPTAPTTKGRGRALLVDDEELVRMSTADMLADLGYDVIEAGSAEEALRLLEQAAPPDLLVTDHLMPGMSGADLAREARLLKPDLPILIVSGYAEVEGIAPDLPRLTKPFRNAELAERLADLGSAGAAAP